MRRIVISILALLLFVPLVRAQEFCARTSVGVNYKIKKGFHIEAQEEMRLSDGLSGISSMRSTIGLSYRVSDYFKLGGGYTLINSGKVKEDYDGSLFPRHRLFAEAAGTYRYGDFSFSLKERLQFTHRTDKNLNVCQNTRNALSLKSSVGAKYRGWRQYGVEPFAFFEIRTALNEPWGETSGNLQTTPTTQRDYYTYSHTGYTHAYINRYRIDLGTVYRPAKHHAIRAGMLLDWCSDFEIDTNSPSEWGAENGLRLFTATTGWRDYFRASLCVGYVYSF